MTALIYNTIASHLTGLAITSEIPDALGTRLATDLNLFVGFEAYASVDSLTLIAYSGPPPNTDGYRQESSMQVRLKTNTTEKALKVGQAVINYLHMKQIGGKAQLQANQSSPMILGRLEGEEWCISTVNFSIKHIKA
uniref:Tail protein n=1 Tax=viral metagenome TaxID=1070528 RepID=A0A6M3KGD2_9ZZZZ